MKFGLISALIMSKPTMSTTTLLTTNNHNQRKFEAYENEIYAKQTTTKENRQQRQQHQQQQYHQKYTSNNRINNNNNDNNNEYNWNRRRSSGRFNSKKNIKLLRNRTTTKATKTSNDIIKQQQHNQKRQGNRIGDSAITTISKRTTTTTTTTSIATSLCRAKSINLSSSALPFHAYIATSSALPKWHKGASLLSAFLLNSTLLVLAANTATTTTLLVDGRTAAAAADINNSNSNNNFINNTQLRLTANNNIGNSLNCSADFVTLGCSSSGAAGGLIAGVAVANVNVDISFNDSDVLSTEKASEYIFDRLYVRVIFITIYTLTFCCCFFGNFVVIFVVFMSRRLSSITNFFLANLAIADLCVGTFCVMQNLSIYLIDTWVFGEFLCRMYQFVHSLSYTASIFILVVICMERYFAIVHPITCKQILTSFRLRMVIVSVWITSAVYSTPKFIFSKTIQNIHTEDGQEETICVLDRKMFNSKLLDMINFGLLYIFPLLVMMVLYTKIAVALWRSSRGLSHHIASHGQQENNIVMHNSMYHHHHAHAHAHAHTHNHLHQNHTQQPPGTPVSGNSAGGGGGGGGSLLSRRQSSKYEKRGVSITESQHDKCKVSLDADRPIVTACRKKSFYHNSHQHQSPASRVHCGMQRNVTHNVSNSSNNVLRARRGVVRMLIIFVLTFALCNLPIHARKMWQYWSHSYRGDSNFNALLTPLTFLVSYFNSGLNPLIYAFLSRNFRRGMRELLLCSWKKGKGKSSLNSSMHHKRTALQNHSLPTDTTHIGNEQL